MRNGYFAQGINCRSLDESLQFYVDVLGFVKAGPGSDTLRQHPEHGAHIADLEKRVLPALFGVEEDVRFRSQLVSVIGSTDTCYELFEWVNPTWVDDEPYTVSNHVGAFRSAVATDDFALVQQRLRDYGANFLSEETDWWDSDKPNATKDNVTYTKYISVRDPNGLLLQIKEVPNLGEKQPGHLIRMVRHREINVIDIDETVKFYTDLIGFDLVAPTKDGTIPLFSELPKLQPENFTQDYIDELSTRCLQDFFGYTDVERCDFKATYVRPPGSSQNLDLFQWVAPKAVGRAYASPRHVGFQRILITHDDFAGAQRRLLASDATIVCEGVDLPPIPLPGHDTVARVAMSVLDPNGVMIVLLGE
ncbi:VOC family protein [Streptomyces gilvus]|uniref:VOC family protein n=1 Tax=Streptomyces gilvus TaxID=2920937 RepID=UPI001F0E56AE|nr:VOC family protein [Streptomyces sp. CME 23]MCH5677959.1 VOC family protein [Streptomyces sp. CME 23]